MAQSNLKLSDTRHGSKPMDIDKSGEDRLYVEIRRIKIVVSWLTKLACAKSEKFSVFGYTANYRAQS